MAASKSKASGAGKSGKAPKASKAANAGGAGKTAKAAGASGAGKASKLSGTAKTAAGELSAQQVELWLGENPDFLVTRPELAASLRMPDPNQGRRISLLSWNTRRLEERVVEQGAELDEAADAIDHNRRLAVATLQTVLDLWQGGGGASGVRKSLGAGFRRRFGSAARLVQPKQGSPLDRTTKRLLQHAPIVFGMPDEVQGLDEVQRFVGGDHKSFVLARVAAKPPLVLILAAGDDRFNRAEPKEDSLLRLLVRAIELRLGGRGRSRT